MNDFVPFNEVYKTAFSSEFPARSAVEVARLPRDVKGLKLKSLQKYSLNRGMHSGNKNAGVRAID